MLIKALNALLLVLISLNIAYASRQEVEKLISEQKYAEALVKVRALIPEAKAKKQEKEWAELVSKEAQLQIGLHGHETAVRDLASHDWPQGTLAHAMVRLMYGAALQNYATSYSWEIRSREKIETKDKVDLKSWTAEEIQHQIHLAFADVWSDRIKLGEHKKDALKEIIVPNTHPELIRDTLRDTYSYLYADFLGDSSNWSPRESNEAYLLDIEGLINKTKLNDKDLKASSVHPVEKLAHVLHDLEDWNKKSAREEAALEARLELLKKLHALFADETTRLTIKDHISKLINDRQSNPWVTTVYSNLAKLIQEEAAPDALVRARNLALKCSALFPKSVGAGRCRDIVKEIELPALSMEAMEVDGPNKKSIALNYQNLSRVHFRSFTFDLKKFLASSKDWSLRPGWHEIKFISSQRPVHEWSVGLPETTDFRRHRFLVTPPDHRPGFYVVLVSGKEGFPEEDNAIVGSQMFFGDLLMSLNTTVKEKIEVEILSGRDGIPLPGTNVSLYKTDYKTGHKKIEEKKTTEQGQVSFKLEDKAGTNQAYFIIAEKDGHLTASQRPFNVYTSSVRGETHGTFIYTDRSIYRPGQKIMWKVVNYTGDLKTGKFQTRSKQQVLVQLFDANHQLLEKKEIKTNAFGSAAGEFIIPAGKLLGQWTISTDHGGHTNIRIEEYKRPTFEVELAESSSPLRINKEAKLKGSAKYYFGSPLPRSNVKWKIERTANLPWWCFWGGWNWGFSRNSQLIDQGASKTQEDGTYIIKFIPKGDERLAAQGITYNYKIEVDVTDEGGETRSTSRNYTIGFTTARVSIESPSGFYIEGATRPQLTVRRNDLNGVPQAGKGKWKLVLLEGPSTTLTPAEQPMPGPLKEISKRQFTTPDDGKLTRWAHKYNPANVLKEWGSGQIVAEGETKNEAVSNLDLPELRAGAYRLQYTTKDAYDSLVQSQHDFLVANKNSTFKLPGYFALERQVKVGDKIRFLAFSGIKDQKMFLETHKDGTIIKRQVLTAGKDPSIIEIPVSEADRGGMIYSLRIVHDHQEMKFSESLWVPWENKEIKMEFATFRDKIRPGNKETWAIELTAPKGKDLGVKSAEVLAYMYDKSLDSFVPHTPPSPLAVFPNHAQAAQIHTELGVAPPASVTSHGFRQSFESVHFNSDRINFLDNYGIGGPGSRSLQYEADGGGIMAKANFAAAPGLSKVSESSFEKKAVAGKEAQAPSSAPEMRSNFSETPFWRPQLLNDKDGKVKIEFTVPDSVTSWNVWAHAITSDLSSGFLRKETKTIKELILRPYLPRFLREGDEAEIKLVINNASDKDMAGELNFDIIDLETEKSVNALFNVQSPKQQFKVKANGSTNLGFKLKAPSKVGSFALKAIARSGNLSDGELRPFPVLPGRFHLSQSRFVSLKGNAEREIKFDDLKKSDDQSRAQEGLVVSLDAQLFYSVLAALPYIIRSPYESIDVTSNNFVSTGIVSAVYKKFPVMADMAKALSSRKTRVEKWDEPDPNRKMTLEESPWLIQARGGKTDEEDLVAILNPDRAQGHRNKSLQTLKNAQTSLGAFPWFPGGPPSSYMTMYVLYDLSKALEFGVEVPKDLVKRGWEYLHRYYVDELIKTTIANDCCAELVTFMNYVLSNYPDDSWNGGVFSAEERKRMTDFSFKHWKSHSPYMKSFLALTLSRAKRTKDAKLVWDSVMDSAKTSQDEGTYWAQEDRSWLWYNDTIETHAMALRTGSEIDTPETKLEGMVQWLFLNKKMNHWKSTRATAEVIYSLTHYLQKTSQLGAKEKAIVKLGGKEHVFEFDPKKYTGKKNQIVIAPEKVTPQLAQISVAKDTPGHLFASATWHYSTEKLPTESHGDFLQVERSYFRRIQSKEGVKLQPLSEGTILSIGDELEVQLSLRSKHPAEYVHLRDPRPAGMEPVDNVSHHKWEHGLYWFQEIRDNGTNFFLEWLPQGQYTLRYRMRAFTAGSFKASPATVQPLYAPEFTSFSSGSMLKINQTK